MNPDSDRNWTFVNECLKHHKKVPNRSGVMNHYNYQVDIDNDTLNSVTVRSTSGRVVLKKYAVSYVRKKHDSTLVFTETEFVFMHFCTGDIFRFAFGRSFYSADVFYDPCTSRARLWVWDGSYLTSHDPADGIVDRYRVNESSDAYMHALDNHTCVYSTRTRLSLYKNGTLTHDTHNPKRLITQVSYEYVINKYFVQTDRYFVIVQKHEIGQLFETSDDFLQFDSAGVVYFTKYQDVVIYESNKHLCVAQTIPPYRISVVRLGDTLRHLCFNDTNLQVQTLNSTYFFSMFPMSFTDSTNIDTTFE